MQARERHSSLARRGRRVSRGRRLVFLPGSVPFSAAISQKNRYVTNQAIAQATIANKAMPIGPRRSSQLRPGSVSLPRAKSLREAARGVWTGWARGGADGVDFGRVAGGASGE